MSAALLTLDHYTSKPFIARMSGAGQVGQMMAEPLSLAHAALRGSAKQEAGMNMVLRLFDPKQTWTRFAKETIAEVLWLPEKEHVWKLLTSDVFQHGKMIRALSQVLDNQFWEEYQTASWHELPAVIGSTLKRDLQAPDSHFVRAQSIASGVPADLMQPVLTMTASIIASWKGDNWSFFLKASTQSVTDMVKTMASKGQLLPDTLQKVLNACLFLTKNVARLISLWSLWHATHDKQQQGNESVALIRQLLVEHADDTTVWAFDKALVWLPVLPGLYRVLKHLQPIEAGQRIQWVTRLLVSLYSQPEVQANPEIIQLREQVQRIAQEWLGAIPDAVLGKAVIEEVEAQPGPVQKAVIKSLYLAIDAAPPLLRLMKSAVNYASAGLLEDVIRGLLQPQPSLVPLIMFLAVIPESSEAVKEASTPKPEPEPQPIDTTPVLGGVTAVTFMAGMVLAFKARKSYREGQLAAQKQEEEADAVESLVMSPVVQTGATSEQDNLIENTTLPDLPVTKNKANNWKIEAALAGVSLLVFSASAYALFKQHTSSATLTASDAATKIEKLCDTLLVMLAVPQEEIELTADAVDQWLKAFTTEVATLNESLASFDALLTPPPSDETNTSPSPPSLARRKKRDTSSQTQQKLEAVFNVVAVPISQTTAPNLQSRATIESDIKATKIELAGFINELSERTRQTQEPFIENNQNYRSKQQFDKLVKLVPEHLEDYNARISRNATRIRNELTPAINDRTARLKFLVDALAKKPKVHEPIPRQSLFFPYENITPAVPIEGITTAHALIAYRWDNVNIDTHGKLEGFKVENTLVRALVYCNHLIEEIVKKRDENIATNPMTFTTRDQYNQDMLVFFDTREKILDLIEYQFINNKRIDARSLVRKNQDREEFILGRITEILDNYLPERSLTAQSLFDVEYHLPAMIHTERFTLIQIAKGIHTLSNNARSPSVCVVKWAELDSPPAQTEILALKDEWQIVKQMTRDSDRTSELMNAAQSADLTAYDIRPYSETYIKKIAATQIPAFQNRQGISGSTRVWEKREEYINPDNKKISRRTPQAPRYQSTNLLEILWGITEKRLSDTVRIQLTYSHSPLFMGTTETGAAKVAKALIYRDFYTHYIGVIENAFKDAETIKLQQELINIKLRSLKAYEFFSSVSLNGRVLPGVVSGFKNLNDHIIYSFPDDKLWKFDTPIAVHNAYKNNTDDFKTFMDSRQFYKNYLANEDNLGMSLAFELFTNPAEEIIKSYQERYTEDADLLIHSKSELQTLKILEQLKFGWCLISVFIGAFTVPSTILGLVFGPLAPLIQSFVADLPDEKNTYLWETAAAGVAELLSSIPNVRGFLDSKVTRKALGLSSLVKNKPIPAAFFTEQGMFKRVPLKLMDKQPLVIPLGTVLQKPGDVDSPAEPVKSFTTVLPGPYKKDQWRKKELWVNHYVFTQFEALKKAGSISLNDDHYQYMTLSFLPDAVSSSRWEFDSMIAPASSTSSGQPSKRKNSKGATMAEVLKDSNEYLTTLLASHPVSYKVSIDGQPDSYSSGDLISDDALSSEGIRFFDQVNYTAPDNNAYCDRLLLALDMPTTILYFTKTLKNNKVNGGENSNALDMLDYLISYDSTARSIVWPSRYNQDFIDTTLSALSSSYIIAELLLEMLMTNIDSHYRVSIAPFSRSAVKTFIQRLAAQAAANIGYQPRYEFPRYYLTGSLFLEELKTLKTQLTSNLATWLVIINYSEGAEPDQATDEVIVLGGSRSAQQGSSSDTANHLGKDVLVHDIDQPGIPLELQPEAVLPLAYADTFVDRTPVIGEITARYLWDKPISVRDGERVRIRVKRHNSRITAKEGIYEVPSGSRGPHAFPHFVAELINREFDNKILFSNTQVRVIAGTRKEVFDTHKKVTGYTYSLEVADRINIYSDINLVSPGNNPYEIIIDFMNEYGLPIV